MSSIKWNPKQFQQSVLDKARVSNELSRVQILLSEAVVQTPDIKYLTQMTVVEHVREVY